jgi:ABC-type branched-subunit amino acid transport system substrate-binding protein
VPRRLAVCALGILASTSGCPAAGRAHGPPPATASEDPRVEADFRRAREAFEEGRSEEAAALFQRFLVDHPEDPLTARARLALAELALARGDLAEAQAQVAEVADHPDPTVAERARFLSGVARHLLGDSEGALDALTPLVGRTTRPEDAALLLTTIAAAQERLGATQAAVEALDQLERLELLGEDARAEVRAELERLVGTAEPEVVDRLADVLPPGGFAFRLAARRAAEAAYQAGRIDRARALLDELAARGGLDDELRALSLRTARTPAADPSVVGAILPLSGRGRGVGQSALRGLLLAAGGDGEAPVAEDGPRLVLRDGGGEPERAVRALEELVRIHRATVVIGPLDALSARAVAERAEELRIPVLLPAPGAQVARQGGVAFELVPRPEDEARALVAEAVRRGGRRLAILRAEHPLGEALGRAAVAEAEARGARVVADVSIPPGLRDLRRPLDAVLGDAAPDAVLFAETPDRVALLAPALAARGVWSTPPRRRNVRTATFLLPSTAWDRGALRAVLRFVEGAVVSLPYRRPARAVPGSFEAAYVARYGEDPGLFAAIAYDAYRLARGAIDEGARTRAALLAALPDASLPDPAAASPGVTPDRRPRRPTALFVVGAGGELQPRY